MNEFLSIPSLLLATCLLLVTITILLVIGGVRRKGQEGDKGSGLPQKSRNTTRIDAQDHGFLVQNRLQHGIESSIEYSRSAEKQLVECLWELAESVPSTESRAEIEQLRQKLDFLTNYRQNYCNQTFPADTEDVRSFLDAMLDATRRTAATNLPPFYRFLLQFAAAVKQNNLLLVAKTLSDYEHKLDSFTPEDPAMATLFSGVRELTSSTRTLESKLHSNRQQGHQALEDLKRILHTVYKRLDQLDIRDTQATSCRRLPESVLLKDCVKQAIELARRTQIEEADEPQFEIKLFEEPEEISVETENLELTFEIRDLNRSSRVFRISVRPAVDSNDLLYQGTGRKNVELKNGTAIVSFLFTALIFDLADFDQRPTIEFRIHYTLFEKEFSRLALNPAH